MSHEFSEHETENSELEPAMVVFARNLLYALSTVLLQPYINRTIMYPNKEPALIKGMAG